MKIVKIPSSELGLDKKGSEEAPDEILGEIENFYLDEDGKESIFSVDTVEVVRFDVERTNENIFNKALETKEKTIFLGGDHSITYPLVKAYTKRFEDLGFLMFDAHPDCVNKFSPPTHEDFLLNLVEDGILKKENVIIVGIRNWHINEFNFLREKGIKVFKMKDIQDKEAVCDSVMELCRNFKNLYLSLDIDVVDPAFAPGTGYIEPGGMTSRDLIYFIQRLRLLKNLRAVDVVEVNPKKDVNKMTVRLAAKIVREFL